MVGPHGVELATSIIASHFGELVAKVCGCMLRRGTLSLVEIIRFTELSNSQIKNCLLVLIQHNCVQAFSVPKGGPGGTTRAVTQYMAIVDNILHRLRFTKFLAVVREDLGGECETLLNGLLQHGRLTFDQLVQQATARQRDVNRDNMRMDFDRLVHGRYVERCPRAEPFIAPVEGEARPSRRRKNEEEALTIEDQAMMAAMLSDAQRFSEISFNGKERSETVDASSSASSGSKRKHENIEMYDDDMESSITETEILWRANFEKFRCCLKKKACITHLRSRYGIDAGIVLESLIESSTEEKLGDKNAVIIASLDSILEGVRGKQGGISMTLDHVRSVLGQGPFNRPQGAGASYSIDIKYIIECCRNEEVESLILARYGKEAFRIFRLLVQKPVETEKVSDETLVEKLKAQNILYKLWKDDYLDMKRVTSQTAGQMHLFLWKVNNNLLRDKVLDYVHHAALNLNQKIAHIVEQEQEGTAKPEQLRKNRIMLEFSLLKLDDALMLFHDF